MTTPILRTLSTHADGHGRWRAMLTFEHTLSENDPRPEYNLHHHWPALRRKARTAIVEQLALREQKSNENMATARTRMRRALAPLVVIDQYLDAENRWRGVTFGER